MANSVQTYALHDFDVELKLRGAFRINRKDAEKYNREGYGIFQTVNYFLGPRRKENLVEINAWFVEIDSGTKESMLAKIKRGLVPTMIVETKKGFHVYWKAKDGKTENWKDIVQNRLIPFYGGDKKAKDICRILRVPGFLHQKDPSDPFLVKNVFSEKVEYSEAELRKFYKDLGTIKKQKRLHSAHKRLNPTGDDFWSRAWSLNCEEALTRLSGTAYVNHETFDFKINSSGTKNIWVNGKSTSTWIDSDGRIGSFDGGGPTVVAWLKYYTNDWKRAIEITKEVFPELNDKEALCQNQQLSLI